MTNPQSPVSADNISYGLALDIVVNGNYAYGVADDAGLVIINITDPNNAYIEGTLDTPAGFQGVDISGNYVYIADFPFSTIPIFNLLLGLRPIGLSMIISSFKAKSVKAR